MARRKSKWRRTWQTLKKMMQDARKVRAYQSLRQCPVCGNPYSLSIAINVEKETEKKSASVTCHACGFRYEFSEVPAIADEFWIYSKVLDAVQSSTSGAPAEKEEVSEMPAEETELEAGIDIEEEGT